MKNLFLLFFGLGCLCSSAQAQMNVLDSLDHQDRSRKYLVHLPPNYNPEDTLSLVIFLHGGSGDINTAQGFTRFNQVANANNFLVVYPQGAAGSEIGGFTWADGRGTPADDLGIDDVGFILKLVDTLQVDYRVDAQRIYVCGFSNGGFLTQKLACEGNAPFAAMASLGASQDIFQIQQCSPGRPIPMMIVTGTADPLVPYEGGPMDGDVPDIISSDSLLRFWRANNACLTPSDTLELDDLVTDDSSTVSQFSFTNCSCDAQVKHLRVNNGGHTWPGVELPDLELVAGETNEDILASQALWTFFKEFSLCQELITSQKEIIQNALRCYPNPSQDLLLIENLPPTAQLSLYDSQGRPQTLAWLREGQLDISHLERGIYFLAIQNGGANRFIHRIFKY